MATKSGRTGTTYPQATIKLASGSGKTRTLSYGTVTARVKAPAGKVLDKVAREGRLVLQRAGTKLMQPGVKLAKHKGVPLYHADPDRPGIVIRRLDGRIERGVFDGREFRVTE